MTSWQYVGTCIDGQRFEIAGVDVWTQQWVPRQGESATVQDPLYGQSFTFPVYDMATGKERVVFAAGEFSNCVWGFYLPVSSEDSM
jgi:hypothetical protein